MRANDPADAVQALRNHGRWANGVAVAARPKLIFVFAGQGSLRAGALATLIEQDADFARFLQAQSSLALRYSGFDVMGWLRDPSASLEAVREDNARTQLTLFCIGVALARWLEHHGVKPDGLLGHSLGELMAAHIAGVLDLESAVRAVYHRGRLMQSTGRGAAMIVRLSERDVAPYVTGDLSVACVNGPQLVLLSGPVDEIEACVAHLKADKVGHRLAPIDVAVHSSRMDAVVTPFKAELDALRFSPARVPILSSVHGRWLSAEEAADPSYWASQVRAQVAFDRAAHTLFEEPACMALELGLGASLTGLLAARRRSRDDQRALNVWGQGSEEAAPNAERLRLSIGMLWANGAQVDPVGPLTKPARLPVLPTYAFQRSTYVVEAPISAPDALMLLKYRRIIKEAEALQAAGERVAPSKRSDYIYSVYTFAALAYAPPPLDSDLFLFRAQESWARGDSTWAWQALVAGRFEAMDVPGNHVSVVRSREQFEPIARALVARLPRQQRSERLRPASLPPSE